MKIMEMAKMPTAISNSYLKTNKKEGKNNYNINDNYKSEVENKKSFDTKFSQSYLIQKNLLSLKKYSIKNGRVSFGKPVALSRCNDYSIQGLIQRFDLLKHAKYTDIPERYIENEYRRNEELRENKGIRRGNFDFLDSIDNDYSKLDIFINYYKGLTGFPNLKVCSQKIKDEFTRTIGVAENKVNGMYKYQDPHAADVIMYGYDGACSVGLEHAWPGSDLDKAFVIIKGPSTSQLSDTEVVNQYKGQLWENMDTRILSVNHYAAFPNVYTKRQVMNMLDTLDRYTKNLGYDEEKARYAIANIEDPVDRAQFNLALSKELPSYLREDAKNFAYLVEPIRECTRTYRIAAKNDDEEIMDRLNASKFYKMTNMGGLGYYMNKYKNGTSEDLKSKLQAREDLEKSFNTLGSRGQFQIIKNLIKNMCDDGEQNKYFECPDGSRALWMNDKVAGKI